MGTFDPRFLRRAIELATSHMLAGHGGPFGAVVVRDGVVVAEGWNEVTSSIDPTAHAEVQALRRAARALGTFELSDCDLYASCQPCPMCLGASYWARVQKLYFAADSAEAARAGFDDAFIYEDLARPVGSRLFVCERYLAREGAAPFDAWLAKADRIAY